MIVQELPELDLAETYSSAVSAGEKDQNCSRRDGAPGRAVHPLARSFRGLQRILGGVEATLLSIETELGTGTTLR